ncbi:hypothetical protein K490DRAFT_37182, partial [Saccharata proteae CBS 121410]
KRQKRRYTFNSWYSLMVTHLTTNQPVHSLCMAERTGCPIFCDLWSNVRTLFGAVSYIPLSLRAAAMQAISVSVDFADEFDTWAMMCCIVRVSRRVQSAVGVSG